MKKLLLSFFMCMLAVIGMQAAEDTATLSFADKAQRTSFSTSKQVWEQNGITLTNDKSSSTSNVADYANPARFYKSSKITVECRMGNITKIEFVCSGTDYATALKSSINTGTVSINSSTVTVTLDGSSDTFTISSLSGGQVRMNSLTVTYEPNGEVVVAKPTFTPTDGTKFFPTTSVTISVEEGLTAYYSFAKEGEYTKYTGAIEITSTTTVYAYAENEEKQQSDIVSATFTKVVPVPTFSPANGATFTGNLDVAIEAEEGLEVYYSFEEKGEYVKYTEAINIASTTTVYAYTKDAQGDQSKTVSAEYTKVAPDKPQPGLGATVIVKDASTLVVGDQIVIVAVNQDFALSTTQNNNNRGQASVVKNGEAITFGDDVQIITLENGTKDGTWAFYTGSGYLYAASSSSNHLKTQANNNDNGSWSVAIDGESGIATIKAQGNTHNWMRYNKDSKLFSCYGLDSNQQDVAIYRGEKNVVEENIGYGMYYLSLGESDVEGAKWYAAHFVNANNGNDTWVYGRRVEDQGRVGVHFGLEDQENTYTHIAFCAMMCDAPVFNEETGKLDDVGSAEKLMNWEFVYAHTDYVTYVPATNPGCVSVYNYNDKVWEEVNPDQATALDRVEAANGIGYAYGVVSAEGAIEVYNVNGAVVARGNNNVDLRGLGRGVYIIRTGNQVRKVVR